MMYMLSFLLLSTSAEEQRTCFGKLRGRVDDCYCSISDVDSTHEKVYQNLADLMGRDYFRYYKVNLNKKCIFWQNMGECRRRSCGLKTCTEDEVPVGLTDNVNKSSQPTCEEEKELSKISNTISEDGLLTLKHIDKYTVNKINFCVEEDEESTAAVFYDLLQNPERYTGYSGEEAHRIWRSIYSENCFRPKRDNIFMDITHKSIKYMCKEKRVFFRAVSGLHASISIHLSAKYPLEDYFGEKWGRNLAEFSKRFMPESTGDEGPHWLKNLYFVYLLEMRALTKGLPIWEKFEFYTGDPQEDEITKEKVLKIIDTFASCPDTFDEAQLFKGPAAYELINNFQLHFRNISQIMDCVVCEKCRLWGKVQTRGLGTALKILFSPGHITDITLERGEVVTLFNAFNQLSFSLAYVRQFKEDMEKSGLSESKPKPNLFSRVKHGEL